MSKRIWVRALGRVGILLIAVCLALYLTLPWYASILLNRFFLPEGWQLHRLEFDHPGWRTLDIHTLELSDPSRIDFTVEEAIIDYDLVSLFSGNIDQARINNVVVDPAEALLAPASEPSDLARLLPDRLLQLIPVRQLAIKTFSIDLARWQGGLLQLAIELHDQQFTANGRLEWPESLPAPLQFSTMVDHANHWRFAGEFEQAGSAPESSLQLSGSIALRDGQLLITVSKDAHITAPLSLLAPEVTTGIVKMALPEGLQLKLPGNKSPSDWFFQGVIAGNYSLEGRNLVAWEIRDPVWARQSQHLRCEVAVVTVPKEWHLPQQGLRVEGITAAFAGQMDVRFSGDEQTAQISWKQPQQFRLQHIISAQWQAENLRVEFPPQTISVTKMDAKFPQLLAEVTLDALQRKTAPEEIVSLRSISATLNLEPSSDHAIGFEAALGRLFLKRQKQGLAEEQSLVLPPMQLSGRSALSDSGRKIDFELRNICGSPLLSGIWEQIPEGPQQLKASIDYRFTEAQSLRRHLNYPELAWDLVEGGLRGQFEWQSAGGPVFSLEGSGINGYLPSGRFEGVQFQLRSDRLTSVPISATAERIEMGVPATDIQLEGLLRQRADNDQWQFAMRRASALLLGGGVSLDNQTLNLSAPSTLILEADSLDLERLIETQQLKGVVAEGLISGTIPVTLENFVPSVKDGFVQAVRNGVIQYQNPLNSEGINPDLKLALDVLSNFNYQVLESSVSYSSEGTLKLSSRIEGSNPDVADGQKVNLNLNTELDLKSAFYALRLQSGLDQLLSDHFASPSASNSDRFCDVTF